MNFARLAIMSRLAAFSASIDFQRLLSCGQTEGLACPIRCLAWISFTRPSAISSRTCLAVSGVIEQNRLFKLDESGVTAAEVEVMVVDNLGVDANISFTHDLADRLEPLKPVLPTHLVALIPPWSQPPSPSSASAPADSATTSPPLVPYSVLYSISKWTRTDEGAAALSANSLNPRSYEMISLLAGTITSPDRRFPAYQPEANDPLADVQREINDRKAVVALINALLSIGGSGVATWYATGVAGWRNEWVRMQPVLISFLHPANTTVEYLNPQRALFSLFFGLLVAIAEGVLFFLWNSRRPKPKGIRGRLRRNPRTHDVGVKLKVE